MRALNFIKRDVGMVRYPRLEGQQSIFQSDRIRGPKPGFFKFQSSKCRQPRQAHFFPKSMACTVNNHTGKGHHLRALLPTAVRETLSFFSKRGPPFPHWINQMADSISEAHPTTISPKLNKSLLPVGLRTPSFSLAT